MQGKNKKNVRLSQKKGDCTNTASFPHNWFYVNEYAYLFQEFNFYKIELN
jgi:hypothetical protein